MNIKENIPSWQLRPQTNKDVEDTTFSYSSDNPLAVMLKFEDGEKIEVLRDDFIAGLKGEPARHDSRIAVAPSPESDIEIKLGIIGDDGNITVISFSRCLVKLFIDTTLKEVPLGQESHLMDFDTMFLSDGDER